MEQSRDAAEISSHRERVASFIQSNLQPAKHLLDGGGLVDFDEDIQTEAEQFEVREHQLDAWSALWDARQAGLRKALVHLATGLGKTSVAVFDVIKFREEFKEKNDREPRILFTSHKNEINEQAAERFAAFIPDMSQGFYNGDKKITDKNLTFATLQSLHSSLDYFDPEAFDYIVYDEAHHNKADTFEAVVKHFKPLFQLALTATPDRMDELDIRELFGPEVYSKGLAQALAEGLLATPDYHIVFDEAVRKAMESGFEAETLRELRQLFEIPTRNEIIAKQIKAEAKRIGLEFGEVKTMVFCNDIAHAEEMAELLDGLAYHSEIRSKKERRKILTIFRDEDLQTITTRDMLSEGVDVPDARLIVFLRSTSSQTVFEQQLGRGLRKKAGKDVVSVLDFAANIERIAMVRELAEKIRDYTAQGGHSAREDVFGHLDAPEEDQVAGLNVHTSYGDFDFDRLSIDLLDKFYSFKRGEHGYNPLNELDDEGIIQLADSLSPDKPMRSSQIEELSKKKAFISKSAIMRRFGSMSEFHKARGFEGKQYQLDPKTATVEQVIEQALELSPDNPLNNADIARFSKEGKFVSIDWITKHFGSIHKFKEACGFQATLGWTITNDEIVALAKKLSPEKPLSQRKISQLSREGLLVSHSTISKRFGSIPAFQRACGFGVALPEEKQHKVAARSINDQTIIDMALALKNDGPLTTSEIEAFSKNGDFVSIASITKRFGNLTNFQQACGFEIAPQLSQSERVGDLTPEEVVKLALEISPDKPLTKREIESLSTKGKFVGSKRVKKMFGTISEFQAACGFRQN